MAMPAVPITHNGAGMNQAQWHAAYESFANQAMAQGYTLNQIIAAVQAAGETWPKDLTSSIQSKNTLFPGADMGYQYDLDNHTKQRPVSYSDPSLGMMAAVPMDASEVDAANKYYAWRENPANFGLISQYGDNPYNAYVAATHGAAIGVTPTGASVLPTSGGASSSSGSSASTAKPITDWYVQKPDGTIVTRASLGSSFDLSANLANGYKSLKNQSLYPIGNGQFSATPPKSGTASSSSGINTSGVPAGTDGSIDSSALLGPLFSSLVASSQIDQQNQLFQLDKAKQQYGAGVGQQNYLSDLYGQVLGVGFNRPNYSPTTVSGSPTSGDPNITPNNNNGAPSPVPGGANYGGPSGFGIDPNNNYYVDVNGNLIPTSRRGQPGVPPPANGGQNNGPGPGFDPNAPLNQDPNQGGDPTGGVFGPGGAPNPGNPLNPGNYTNPPGQVTTASGATPANIGITPSRGFMSTGANSGGNGTPPTMSELVQPNAPQSATATSGQYNRGIMSTDNTSGGSSQPSIEQMLASLGVGTVDDGFGGDAYNPTGLVQNLVGQGRGGQPAPSPQMAPGTAPPSGSGAASASSLAGVSGSTTGGSAAGINPTRGGGPSYQTLGTSSSGSSGTTQPVVQYDPNATTNVPWSQNPANPYVSDPWWNGTYGTTGPPGGSTSVAHPNGTTGTFNDGQGGTYTVNADGTVTSSSTSGNQTVNNFIPNSFTSTAPVSGANPGQGSGYYQLGNSFNPNNPSTWALLGAPASQIAGDLDSQKRNIMMNMPAGGERDKALADAMNSSYGNLSGLRQGLVSQSLQGIGNISQSQISGTAVPNSGSAGTAAGIGSSLLSNNLGIQQLNAQKSQNSNSMWGSILGAVAPVVLGAILSDVRTKEGAEPFTRGLTDLMKVEPFSYAYNGKGGSKRGQRGISVMAQDLKRAIPEAVIEVPTEDFPDTHMILPMGLLMTAVNSIQELNVKVSKLERKKK